MCILRVDARHEEPRCGNVDWLNSCRAPTFDGGHDKIETATSEVRLARQQSGSTLKSTV